MVWFLRGSCSNEELQIENYQLKIANWKSVRDFLVCNFQFAMVNFHLQLAFCNLRPGSANRG